MLNKPNLILLLVVILLTSGCKKEETKPLTLKEAYKDYYYIGAAINGWQITGKDTLSGKLLKEHFSSITPENIMKWQVIHPQKDTFQFDLPDQYVALGESLDMFIVGHTLVWHSQLADYVYKRDPIGELRNDTLLVDSATLVGRIKDHINAVVGRYKGRVHGWDVVNEAMNEDGSFRNSNFYKITGKSFIHNAFRFAHEVDPKAELYYNDYNMTSASKRDGVIGMVKEMKELGIPIDGIGMQGHWSLTKPSLEQIEESIVKFSELGVKVMITELDVSVLPNPWDFQGADVSVRFEERPGTNPYTEGLPDSVQQQLTTRYAEIFTLFNKHKDKISRVTLWGVHDGQSWLNNFPVRGRTNYPLLFDRNVEAKPAVQKIIDLIHSDEE